MKKLLYSPGFGAGWTTWEGDPEIRKFMVSYQRIIEALEREESLSEDHPAIQSFKEDCEERFGQVPCILGLRDLEILEVGDTVEVSFDEYDGSESPLQGFGRVVLMGFPLPTDEHPEGTVVASVHYGDHDNLATILVLRASPPFFRVGVWDFDANAWDGNGVAYEDHMNIVPAIEGEAQHKDGQFTGEHKMGYVDMGGDY